MALQPFLKISSFTGNSNENFDEFENLLRAAIVVGQIDGANQPAFLKLNLSGGALRFYTGLPNATQANLENALTALRDRYNQTANSEFHRIRFNERKFDSTKESPEDYIVDLQKLALKAFQNIAAVGGAPAIDRGDERTRRVKEAFIQGMPIKFKRKLLKEPPERTVDELGRMITKELWIMNTYPEESYPGAFQQLSQPEFQSAPGLSLSTLHDRQETIYRDLSERMNQLSGDFQRSMNFNRSNTYVNQPRQQYNRSNYGKQYSSTNWSPRGGTPTETQNRSNAYNNPANRGYTNSPYPDRKLFCRRCGSYGHQQSRCQKVPQQRTQGSSLPFNTTPKN